MFSSRPAELSDKDSGRVVKVLLHTFVRDYDNQPPAEKARLIEEFTFPVRKAAHMAEYAILAILWLGALHPGGSGARGRRRLPAYPAAFLVSLLYACSDELHQHFVPGRSGELRDVAIDCTGALLGLLSAACIFRLLRHHSNKRR